MRKIRKNCMLVLALMPLLTYLLVVFRSGTAPGALVTLQEVFGDFGAFFEPLLSPVLSDFVSLASQEGIALFAWIVGYYVSLILVYLLFSMFTFLVTMFMDKIDHIKGGN